MSHLAEDACEQRTIPRGPHIPTSQIAPVYETGSYPGLLDRSCLDVARNCSGVDDRSVLRNPPNDFGSAHRSFGLTGPLRPLQRDRGAQGIPVSRIRLTSCAPNGFSPTAPVVVTNGFWPYL